MAQQCLFSLSTCFPRPSTDRLQQSARFHPDSRDPHSPSRMFSPLRLNHPFRLRLRPFASQMNPISASTNPPSSIKTVRVAIKGRVQGVFFRDWTVENARELGLNGWVRNRRDGSVEAVFSGDADAVNEMVEKRCRVGPPYAVVTGITSLPSNDEDPGQGFQRKPTV